MNNISIHFPIAPLSQNNIERSGKNRKTGKSFRYKTKEARRYRELIQMTLLNHKDKIVPFLSQFDDAICGLKISYIWKINHVHCLTKKKKGIPRKLSARGGDTANFEKYTTDCIFDFIGLNDVYLVPVHQKKVPSMERSSFHATIESFYLKDDPDYAPFLDL